MQKVLFYIFLALFLASGVAVAKELTAPNGYTISTEPVQTRIAYDASGNVEYIGKSAPGVATTAEKWQIQKFVYTDGNLTATYFADGDMGFSKAWDSREGYDYE